MSKITTRTKRESGTPANYENFNILDADGNWTGANISYNADREHSEENFDALIESMEKHMNVSVTQDRPTATKANFGKPTK